MEPIKRRGFVGGFLGLFGLDPMGKTHASAPPVVSCREGDILELDIDGRRCRVQVWTRVTWLERDSLHMTLSLSGIGDATEDERNIAG